MAKKIFFRMTIVNDDGSPGSGCYVRAVDNAAPTSTLPIWEDADGATVITDSIVEADEYGDVHFFGEGAYDLKVYRIVGTGPVPEADELIRTYEQVALFEAEPVFDPDSTDTEDTLAYVQQKLARAHFGKASLAGGTIVLQDDAAVYSLNGGAAGSVINSVTATGDFQLVESRIVIIHFTERYQLKNDVAGDLVLDGDLWTWDGTILGLVYTGGKLREMFRSHNVNKSDDVAYIDEAVTTYGTDGETLVVPTPCDVVVVTPGDDPCILREIWWLAEGQRAKPGQRLTLIFAAAMEVADGGELKLAGDFNPTAESSLSLIAVKNSVGTVRWYETARTLVDPPDDYLSEEGGDVTVSATQSVYRIRGRANTGSGFMPDLETITGGYKQQLITIRCVYPQGYTNDADLLTADESLKSARRKVVSANWADLDAFTGTHATKIYLRDSDDFYMLPGDMLTLRRVSNPGVGSGYVWVEEGRSERLGWSPLLDTDDGDLDAAELVIWRHSHILRAPAAAGVSAEIETIVARSAGYQLQINIKTGDTGKIRFTNAGISPANAASLLLWGGDNKDLDDESGEGGIVIFFISRGNGYWTEIANPGASQSMTG